MAYQQIGEPNYGETSIPVASEASGSSRPIGDDTTKINKYETSLPIRVDIEAALTYLIGCVTGVLFLILEQKNDYVRFHAWQSCLIFFTMLILHLIFIWQPIVSIILMVIDFLIIALLMFKAYKDGQGNLTRFQVPLFGNLASKWVDSE